MNRSVGMRIISVVMIVLMVAPMFSVAIDVSKIVDWESLEDSKIPVSSTILNNDEVYLSDKIINSIDRSLYTQPESMLVTYPSLDEVLSPFQITSDSDTKSGDYKNPALITHYNQDFPQFELEEFSLTSPDGYHAGEYGEGLYDAELDYSLSYISDNDVAVGETFTIWYRIINHEDFDIRVWLGASVVINPGVWLSDPDHDKLSIIIHANDAATDSRLFRVQYDQFGDPENYNIGGSKMIRFAIWDGPFEGYTALDYEDEPITIRGPDLKVTAFLVNTTVGGGPTTVSFSVQNMGNLAATNFHLSFWKNWRNGDYGSCIKDLTRSYLGAGLTWSSNFVTYSIPSGTPSLDIHADHTPGSPWIPGSSWEVEEDNNWDWKYLDVPPDTTPPILITPPDIEFVEGSGSYSIVWTAYDMYPSTYVIFESSSSTEPWYVKDIDTTWDGSSFSYPIGDLTEGVYFFKAKVWDVGGNIRESGVVKVKVNPPLPSLLDVSLDATSAVEGGIIKFNYYINNPFGSSICVGLGASLFNASGTFDDPENDVTLWIPSYPEWQERYFDLNGLSPGNYGVVWGLWYQVDGIWQQVDSIWIDNALKILALPDLTIDNIVVSSNLIGWESFSISFDVFNVGGSVASNFDIEIWSDYRDDQNQLIALNLLYTIQDVTIVAGGYHHFYYPCDDVGPGYHILEIHVDCADEVIESDEDQNWWWDKNWFKSPDLILENIKVYDVYNNLFGKLASGQPFTLEFDVRNGGDYWIDQVYTIAIIVDEGYSRYLLRDVPLLGTSFHISETFVFSNIGMHSIDIIVDYYQQVGEANKLTTCGIGTGEDNQDSGYSPYIWAAEWTVIIYLDGDNNLDVFADNDLEEIGQIGSNSEMSVICLKDGASDGDTFLRFYMPGIFIGLEYLLWVYYYIEYETSSSFQGDPLYVPWLESELDMANPRTLTNFVEWSASTFQAQHYALIVMDHGGGADNILLQDGTNDNIGMSVSEFGQALEDTAIELDIVGFDACIMGMVEIAYQLRNSAEILVASEDNEQGRPELSILPPFINYVGGWPYHLILSGLQTALETSGTISSQDFASLMVDEYYIFAPEATATMGAFKIFEIVQYLVPALDNLAQLLLDNIASYESMIYDARITADQYPGSGVDLVDFLEKLQLRITNSEIQYAIQVVLDSYSASYINHCYKSAHPDSHGIAIYFPQHVISYNKPYDGLDCSITYSWDEFVWGFHNYLHHPNQVNSEPSVSIITPSEGLVISGEWYFIWDVSDSNYDRIWYTAEYSPNLGQTWYPFFTTYEYAKGYYHEYLFDSTDLPDSKNMKFRLHYDDEWGGTGVIVSGTFEIDNLPNRQPIISITGPIEGQICEDVFGLFFDCFDDDYDWVHFKIFISIDGGLTWVESFQSFDFLCSPTGHSLGLPIHTDDILLSTNCIVLIAFNDNNGGAGSEFTGVFTIDNRISVTLTIAISDSSIVYPQSVLISSTIIPAVDGREIILQISNDGVTWIELFSDNTVLGAIQYNLLSPEPGNYYLRAIIESDSNYKSGTSDEIELEVDKIQTQLSIVSSTSFLILDDTVLINGWLTPSLDNHIAEFYWSYDDESWQKFGEAISSNGVFTIDWTPTLSGDYYIMCVYFGDAHYYGSISNHLELTISERYPTTLITEISSTSIRYDTSATINVTISPILDLKYVVIEYSVDGLDWQEISAGNTGSNGKFIASWIYDPGTYYIRSRWDGDPQYWSAISEIISLEIYDDIGPQISGQIYYPYDAGTLGHFLDWNIIEPYPGTYEILKDGNPIYSGQIESETISIAIDGLNPGLYVFTLWANDAYNNPSSMDVTVEVFGNTPYGIDVEVVDSETGVSIVFDETLTAGITTIIASTTPPHPHTGFKLGGNYYYDITTTATYIGTITIALPYEGKQNDAGESNLKLKHLENGEWIDVTLWIDVVNNIAYGEVNSLSWFAVLEDDTPPVTVIDIDGTPGDNDWFTSGVTITLTSTDEGLGVETIAYSFDEVNWIEYTGPFTFSEQGEFTIYFNATDVAGNPEVTKSDDFKIDLPYTDSDNALIITTRDGHVMRQDYNPITGAFDLIWDTYMPAYIFHTFALNDTNNDGHLELYVSGYETYIRLMRFDYEDGSLLWSWQVPAEVSCAFIFGMYFEDLNNDGIKEIVTQHLPRQVAPTLFIHDSDGNLLAQYNPGWRVDRGFLADYNGDGVRDAYLMAGAAIYPQGQPRVQVVDLRNFAMTQLLYFQDSYSGGMTDFEVVNIDADPQPEFFVAGWGPPVVAYDHDGTFLWQRSFPGGNADRNIKTYLGLISLGTGIVCTTSYSEVTLYAYYINMTTGADVLPPLPLWGRGSFTIDIFDLNGDGFYEVALYDWTETNARIHLWDLATGTNLWTYDVSRRLYYSEDCYDNLNQFIDYDGDGKRDLIFVDKNMNLMKASYDGTLTKIGDVPGIEAYYWSMFKHVDQPYPQTTVTLDGTIGFDDWYSTYVEFSLNAIDDVSGVARIEYSYDGIDWITYSNPIVVSANGINILYYRSIDNAGNIEPYQIITIKIDTTAPITEAFPSGDVVNAPWYTSPVTISLEVNDEFSGIYSTEFSFDGVTWIEYSIPVTIHNNGQNWFYYRSTDRNGNVETNPPIEILIDQPSPFPQNPISFTSTHIVNTWSSIDEVFIEWFGASDAFSGVYGYSYEWSHEIDTLPDTILDTTSTSLTTTLESGIWYLHIRTSDVAGNWAFSAYHIGAFRIDDTLPNVYASALGVVGQNNYYLSSVDVVIWGFDLPTGLDYIMYSLDGVTYCTYLEMFTLEYEYSYDIRYYGVDNLGNPSLEKHLIFSIDKTRPSTSISRGGTQNLNGQYIESIDISLSCEDQESGPNYVEYRLNGGPWHRYDQTLTIAQSGFYLFECYSVDMAGNCEVVQSIEFEVINYESGPVSLSLTWDTGNIGIVHDIRVGDVDADGRNEIVLAIESSYGVGHVRVYDGLTHSLERIIYMADGYARSLALGDCDHDGTIEIVVGTVGTWQSGPIGRIRVFSGTTGALEWETVRHEAFHTVGVEDIDADGAMEIIGMVITERVNNIRTPGTVMIIDGQTKAIEWETSSFGFGIGDYSWIGNLDDDPALELVFGGRTANDLPYTNTIWIVDGATHTVQDSLVVGALHTMCFDAADYDIDGSLDLVVGFIDQAAGTGFLRAYDTSLNFNWEYFIGTGLYSYSITMANLDTDPTLEIAAGIADASGNWYGHFRIIDAVSQSLLYTRPNKNAGLVVCVEDINGDGFTELAIGYHAGFSSGCMEVYDTGVPAPTNPSLEFLWETGNIGIVHDIVSGDVDADGVPETIVAIEPGYGSTGYIQIYNGITHSLERTIYLSAGYARVVALGDPDEDGQIEILVGTCGWWQTGPIAGIAVYNGLTGALEWLSPINNGVYSLWVEDIDADGEQEIIGITDFERDGSNMINGLVLVYNGKTHSEEWRSSEYGLCLGGYHSLANIDSDPALELIFGSRDSLYAPFEGTLFIVDGASHEVQDSISLGPFLVTSIQTATIASNGSLRIIAGLREQDATINYVNMYDNNLDLLWSYTLGTNICPNIVKAANFDSDQNFEIAVGIGYANGAWTGEFQIIDWETNSIIFQRTSTNSVISFYYGDFDFNGIADFAVGYHAGFSAGSMVVYSTGVTIFNPTPLVVYVTRPVLNNPGTISTDGSVSLSWTLSVSSLGSISYYQVQYSASPIFSIIQGEFTTTDLQISLTALPYGECYLRVRAIDDTGSHSYWSNDEYIDVVREYLPPSIDNPEDIIFEEGITGENIVWAPVEANPQYYKIFLDGALFEVSSWSGGPVEVSLDGLVAGNYYFIIQVFDIYNNWIADAVVVIVEPATPPSIDNPIVDPYEAGTTGHTITWSPDDFCPISFIVYLDNVEYTSGDWFGGTITIAIDGLDPGVYEFRIQVYDQVGLSSSSTVIVTVVDLTPPVLPGISFNAEGGSIGNVGEIQPFDLYPGTYEIYYEGGLVASGEWDGITPIQFIFDASLVGVFTYEFYCYDAYDNVAYTEFTITVVDTVNPDVDGISSITYEEGSTGNVIVWTATDLFQSNYEITLNGVPVFADLWVGNTIEYSIDGHSPGTYYYTVTCYDTSGNSASHQVTAIVVDTTPPAVDGPTQIEYEAGSLGNQIFWTASEPHPLRYMISLDGEPIVLGLWSGNDIQRNIDGHNPGTYYYTLTCWDVFNNEGSHEVTVVVEDTTKPLITSPLDDIYVEAGSSGNTITWYCFDLYPDRYILWDGVETREGPWTGTSLTITIIDRGVGAYNHSITFFDANSNWASDSVWVYIVDTTPPSIDGPLEIVYEDGTTGHTIVWTATDLYPTTYEVTLNGGPVFSDDWTSGTIEYNIDGHTAGTYHYTLICYDESGNSASHQVTVIVEDTTPPSVSGPSEIIYEAGSTGNQIVWDVFDLHPFDYEISLNGVPVRLGLWGGTTISYNIDGNDPGTYYYILTCWDVFNNAGSHQVTVIVEDTTPPDIIGPDDLVYEAGVPGHSLTWSFSDLYPDSYIILRNGTQVDSGLWIGSDISISVDLLNPGTYNFTFVAFDAYGNQASDTAWLTVEGNTPAGSDIEVIDPETGISLTFDETSVPGTTEVEITETGPHPPDDFRLMGLYYNITTTAVFDGVIIVALPYDATLVHGLEKNLKLWHWAEPAGWQDCTTWVDEVNNIIYGEVTHLSIFGAMEDNAPPTTHHSLSGTEGLNGWFVSDVFVELTAVDTVSEIENIYYSVDGVTWFTYTSPELIQNEGLTTFYFYSIDIAENIETINQIDIYIDKSCPFTYYLTGGPIFEFYITSWSEFYLTFSDDISGVSLSFYRIDGGSWIEYDDPFYIFGSDGYHTLGFYSIDTAGNCELETTVWFFLDNTAPVTTKSIGSPTVGEFVTTETVFALTSVDAGIGYFWTFYRINGGSWIEYSDPFSLLGPDGEYTIEFYSVDFVANEEIFQSQVHRLDNTPPETVLSFGEPISGDYITSVTPISLAANDGLGVGVDSIFYCINGGGWETYSGSFTVLGPDDTYLIEYYSIDYLGNTEDVLSIVINLDNSAPISSLVIGTPYSDPYLTSFTEISINVADGGSGVAALFYSIDSGLYVPYIGPFTLPSVDGLHSISYYGIDNLGNMETSVTEQFVVDDTSPVTSIIEGSPIFNSYITSATSLSLSAIDEGVGVDSIFYRIDEGAWVLYSSSFYLVGPDGQYIIEYYSVDYLGAQEDIISETYILDNTAPSSIHTFIGNMGDNDWFVSIVAVELSSSDAGSGVSAIFYSLDAGPATEYVGSFDVTVEGFHNLEYWVVDNLGNVEAPQKSADFKIDTVAPESIASLTPAIPNGLANWYISPIGVVLSFSDDTSGVCETYYRVNGAAWIKYESGLSFIEDGVYLLEFWSSDFAGNQESTQSVSFTLDQTSPITSHSICEPKFSIDPTYIKTVTPITLEAVDNLAGVARTEYRINMGVWIEYLIPFYITEFGYHTINYRSIDVAGNLEDYHSFDVIVNAVELTYIGEVVGDYSDPTQLQAQLVDIATQELISGKVIYFILGAQSTSAVTDEFGIATASMIINQPAGVYTVVSTFNADSEFSFCDDSASYTIEKETAIPEYTGSTVVPTTSDEITIRVTVFDEDDGFYGDITRIQVTFRIYNVPIDLNAPVLVFGPVYLEESSVDGVGVITLEIDNLSENGYIIIVSIESGDNPYYNGPDSDPVILTIFEPTGDFVTGGGWIIGPSGSKSNFGFNVKYTKKGLPKGQSIYTFREGDWLSIIKSNAWIGMAIEEDHAFFEGRCTIQKYNSETGELLWDVGNYQFRVDVWDVDESGGIDVYQIRVLDKNGLVFHEIGFAPIGYLGGGNIAIHLEKEE
ncbi:MAG: hypothetical protein JW779_03255 [Candidatus Thorarchaeota archaeon]|nr:hypothetical protein [Candidatus Thorarchaeota archaeon]